MRRAWRSSSVSVRRGGEGSAPALHHDRRPGPRRGGQAPQALDKFVLGHRLAGIGGSEATAYVAHRQTEAVPTAPINRELAVLIKMLRLAPSTTSCCAFR